MSSATAASMTGQGSPSGSTAGVQSRSRSRPMAAGSLAVMAHPTENWVAVP